MVKLAETQSKIIAEQAIQRAVGELFKDAKYGDFVTLSRLEDGTISAIESNMNSVNQLKASAAIKIQESLSSITEADLLIPMGSLTGYDLLAGIGPRLSVRLMPYGRILVSFKSNFTEAGINQTRLEVSLEAKANVGLVMPSAMVSSEVTTEVPVVQTVIVGKVPENYVNVDRDGYDFEGDVMDLIN